MTAVPAQRKKTKDPFQMELDKEIARRKTAGLATGFSEDDYEDDFDEEDSTGKYGMHIQSKTKQVKQKGKKWEVPSYLISDDDDDEIILDGSNFIKKSANSNTYPTKSPSKEATQKSTRGMKKQKHISEESFESNPLLSLLSNTPSTQSSHRIQSSNDEIPRSTSPNLNYTMKPRSKTPIQTSLQEDDNSPVYPSLTPKPRTRSKDKPLNQTITQEDSSALIYGRSGDVKKSSSSLLDDILLPKQHSIHSSHGDTKTLSKSHEKNDSQSIIDMLLANNSSEPVPKPRKKDVDPQVNERSRSRSHSGSRPGSAKSRNRSKTPPAKEKITTSETPKQNESDSSLLGQLPSLTGLRKSQTFAKDETLLDHKQTSHRRTRSKEKDDLEKTAVMQKQSTTDDLLALFDQTVVETVPSRQQTVTMQSESVLEQKSPVEEVIEKTNEQTRASTPKQRSSKQLYDNIIENVASHNQENDFNENRQTGEIKSDSQVSLEETHTKKSGKPKSSVKSPRRPPASYQGLGSLTAHKQLKLKQDSSENLNTSEDIRKSIYMNWLAEREKQRKIQKKIEQKKVEEKNEKKKKELEDKFFENEGARNAWMQQKEEQIKEKEKRKRREERKAREQKLHKEEEKWKSQKKCEVLRQKALEEAKAKHREELKKKRQDEQLKKEKEKRRQEESKKAMNEWLEKRSKQWEEGRKKEAKEKRKQEKEVNKSKKEKEEEGLRKYQTWRERKDNELIRSRSSIHVQDDDDDRPPWSPANKIIPKGR